MTDAPGLPADDPEAGPPTVGLTFVGHATVRLEIDELRILTDPFLRDRLGPLERHGPTPDLEALEPPDVVVISHGHPDHFDRTSLAALPGRPLVVVPRGLGMSASHVVDGEVVEVTTGDQLDLGRLTITAVPARHWISPGAPRAQPIGYMLDVGRRIYFAGDTGPMPGLGEVIGRVDVALLPVWTWGPHRGPGHLGPRSAAAVAAELGPIVAVPIHWGTLYPRRLHRVWSSPLLEPGDRFAAHAAGSAPDVDVRVLRPGDAVSLELRSR